MLANDGENDMGDTVLCAPSVGNIGDARPFCAWLSLASPPPELQDGLPPFAPPAYDERLSPTPELDLLRPSLLRSPPAGNLSSPVDGTASFSVSFELSG